MTPEVWILNLKSQYPTSYLQSIIPGRGNFFPFEFRDDPPLESSDSLESNLNFVWFSVIRVALAHVWETAEQERQEQIEDDEIGDEDGGQEVWNAGGSSHMHAVPHTLDPFSAQHSKHNHETETEMQLEQAFFSLFFYFASK